MNDGFVFICDGLMDFCFPFHRDYDHANAILTVWTLTPIFPFAGLYSLVIESRFLSPSFSIFYQLDMEKIPVHGHYFPFLGAGAGGSEAPPSCEQGNTEMIECQCFALRIRTKKTEKCIFRQVLTHQYTREAIWPQLKGRKPTFIAAISSAVIGCRWNFAGRSLMLEKCCCKRTKHSDETYQSIKRIVMHGKNLH
jgi:hypothetical protein